MTDDLYQSNLEALRTYQPHLAPRFDGAFTAYTRLVGSTDTADLDLDLGHTLLYGTDAKAHSEAQVERFLSEKSQRILQGWPKPPDHGDRIAERM